MFHTKFKIMSKQKQVSKKVLDEVASVLNGLDLSMDKAARALSKGLGKNAKLNRFLNADFKSGLSTILDPKRREQILDQIASHGYSSMQEKQALVIKILQGDVDRTVKEKYDELTNKGKEVPNKEQADALPKKLDEYRNFLLKDLVAGIMPIAADLGVIEDAPAAPTAPATTEQEDAEEATVPATENA